MQSIQSPINQNSPLATIANLQDALLILIQKGSYPADKVDVFWFADNLRPERDAQKYGDITQKLVVIFQEQRQLQVTGEVDEATAQAINVILRGYGVLDEQGGWTQVVDVLNVHGETLSSIKLDTDHLASIDQKIGSLGKPTSLSLYTRGEAVKGLHLQLVSVGVTLPVAETSDSIFGVGTRNALLQLQVKHNLNTTGLLDDATRNALAIEVGNIAQPMRLEGRIFLDNGLPASNIKLRIVNKGFGEDATVLGDGEIETDEHGFYALPYSNDGAAVNIEVHTFDAEGNIVRLSKPKVNADRNEVLNLVAPSTVKSQANEFKLILDDLMSVKGLNPGNFALAQENANNMDISLLHQSTNWDARLIATAATAAKASVTTGIANDALYGVFRAGLPNDPEALAMVSIDAFATALRVAKDAGIIALDDAQMNDTQTAFEGFKHDTLLKSIVPGGLSSIGDILTNARIDPGHKQIFEKLVLMHDGDQASLWKEAKDQGISDESISNLQVQGKLAYLTLNNAPLVEMLQDEITSQENLTRLVDKDLYRKDQWAARLNTLAGNDDVNLAKLIPSAYAQKELNDRREAYAEDLASRVRQSFPTHVVNRMLENDELMLGTQHAELKAPVQTFLNNAIAKGFQLGSTPVDQFLKQHGKSVFVGITDENKPLAEAGAKLLTRLYQMTPDDESMMTLLKLGYTSAREVAIVPKAEFVERYWNRFGSRILTEKIWDKSEQITSVTFNIFSLGKKIDSTPPIMAISGSPERHGSDKDKLNALLKEYPTMESLFGSLDFCECEHCRSVLSPAAYLVDLLRFIDPAEQDWGHTLSHWMETHNQREYTKPPYNYLKPFDALIQRRPDLPYLPLTCENTNTALPYIDLVNEILEYFIANNQLDAKAAYDTGEATSAELLAEPQNIIPSAYDILRGASYPFTLPFDLWLETVRRFCEYFETPFSDVLDVFRPSDDLFAPAVNPEDYYRSQIYSEYLGISPSEYAIYTAPAWADWLKLYGYDKPGDNEASTLAKLKSAKTLSHRLGISYIELVELLQTSFVNPNLTTLVILRKLGVEVGDVFRYKQHPAYLPDTQEQIDEATFEAAEFEKRLQQASEKYKSTLPDFDAKQWLGDAWHQGKFEKILVLRDPNGGCNFDETTVCYSDVPDVGVNRLDYVKLNLFVRLWKRLGWTMEETDRALQVFLSPIGVITEVNLGAALKTALIYLAHLKELTGLMNVGNDSSRIKLLSLWVDLPTNGKNSLYAQLFLTRNILKDDAIFDHPLGNYLSKPDEFLKNHLPALQASLNLTADEITQILQDGNTGDDNDVNKATLSLPNVSLLYRYGLLAKALKLSIAELISIKALSGLKPFHSLSLDVLNNIDADYPLKHTLEFVHHVHQVKASAFTISDLDYLMRHRFDPLGKYRENNDANLAWIRTLATELYIIASDYSVPTDMDGVNDDALRQKMTLVFPSDVVEMFMGFWLNKTVYSVTKSDVPLNNRLDPNTYSINGVNVSYDKNEIHQRQQLTHIGILTGTTRIALLNQIPLPLSTNQDAIDARKNFSDLLNEVESKSKIQFETFFNKYFEGLFKFEDFFSSGITPASAANRLGLLQKILPFLQAKLTQQVILQTMTTLIVSDTPLIETLLINPDFLALPNVAIKPLMNQFEGLGQRGLTATLTLSDSTLPIIQQTTESVVVKESDKYSKGLWRGGIEVPQNGLYRFYAKLGKKDATVKLLFDGMLEPILNAVATKNDDELSEFIDLKSGVLYLLTLEADNLQDGAFELLVKGETTPKDKLSQFVLLPQTEIDQAVYAYTMLNKAVQLIQGLNLNIRDINHILKNRSDFGNVNLSLLPVKEDMATDANTVALFNTFKQLMSFAVLKRDMAGGSDDLITIFEFTRIKNPETVEKLCNRIAILTRRTPDVVQAIAIELKMTTAEHFAMSARMERLWQGLQVVEKFGVSMLSLKLWLTAQPDAAVAMSIRNTIKSRFEQETWGHIAKAIFDPLRQRQRDALVAYIMHIKEDEGLDSVEKLFEYFLIDPSMEPVVQTSRLRLAISSLQTFIQRCFLNLEKKVHPSVLNAQHWAWMKRYRVWEANRKIFLFPENWLEPEWRDDKTHLYQELESSLMQGDVTNQLAEDALYVYLKKLDQLARLEIVTMYAEEKSFGPPIMHVIGRTYALPHQYFYRCYAHQMWTAWEPVTTEIDGEHIVAVIWRERLHLFWLTFMEKVVESENSSAPAKQSRLTNKSSEVLNMNTAGIVQMIISPTSTLAEMGVNDLISETQTGSKGLAKRLLDIQLNWSEYFQGGWSVHESSGFGNLIDITGQSFNPAKVSVTVSKEVDPGTGADAAVSIEINGIVNSPYFRVVSKNSRPQFKYAYGSKQSMPYSTNDTNYNTYISSGPFSVIFVKQNETTDGNIKDVQPAPQTILSKGGGFTLLSSSNQMKFPSAEFARLISPFFYADDISTFFIEPSLTETTVDKWQGYTITRPTQKPRWDDFVFNPPPISPVIPPKFMQEAFKQSQVILQAGPVDSLALHSIKTNLDTLTQLGNIVQFGDAVIGSTGLTSNIGNLSNLITGVSGAFNQKR